MCRSLKDRSRIRMELLRPAARDYRFLLARNYSRKSALTFVGNHYQLSSTERNILYRSVFPRAVAKMRRAKMVSADGLKGRILLVDGHNCLITLENAMRGIPVVLADDGFIRDAGLVFRGFKQSGRTRHAWLLISEFLKYYRPKHIYVLLDAPYSGSGRLASSMNVWLSEAGLKGEALTLKRPEREIAAMKGVKISADSIIIDHADTVFDLAGHIIRYKLRRQSIKI